MFNFKIEIYMKEVFIYTYLNKSILFIVIASLSIMCF